MESSGSDSRFHLLVCVCVYTRACEHMLEKFLALRVFSIDGPGIILVLAKMSCSLDVKGLGNFFPSLNGPQYSEALNTYQCYQSGKKFIKFEDNYTHQTNYPEALLANEISQKPCPALINQQLKPTHLQY